MIGSNSTASGDDGWSNSGLYQYNKQIIDNNRCFQQLFSHFIDREKAFDTRYGRSANTLAVDSENTNITSGWHWDLAMNVSHGDKNLAMMLIGQCGHDDAAAALPLNCGNGSLRQHSRYRSGSLGKSTLLDPEIVNLVTRIQSPTKGASGLGSKYYHLVGAAYLACSLVRAGMSAPRVHKAQAIAGRSYRVRSLCASTRGNNYRFNNGYALTELLQKLGSVENIAKLFKTNWNATEFGISQDSIRKQIQTLSRFQERVVTETTTIEGISIKIQEMLSFADASEIVKTDVLSMGDCVLPAITKRVSEKMKSIAESKGYICKGLSEERCKRAKSRLLTWYADFEWTEAQHRKGAEFATEQCSQDKDFISNLETRACIALEKNKQAIPVQINSEAVAD